MDVKIGLTILVLFAAVVGNTSAVGLQPSPLHDAMQRSLAAERWQFDLSSGLQKGEEFGEVAGRTPAETGRKSVLKAALFSALVPGGGQYYLDRHRTARYYFAAEAATWIGYIAFRTYGNWRKTDYIDFAAVYADAQLAGKSEDFLSWVGFYSNIREFNNLGRAFDPERPYLWDTPANHWEWQTDQDRQTYRDLRNRSKEAYRKSDFMIGAAIVNRIVSVIDAVRSAIRMNRRIGDSETFSLQERCLKLRFDPLASRQLSLTVYPGF